MDISELSGSAAKLLLAVIVHGHNPSNNQEWMEWSGVTAKKSFYRAKDELVSSGCLGVVSEIPLVSVKNATPVSNVNLPSVKSEPVVSKVNLVSVINEPMSVKSDTTGVESEPLHTYEYIPESLVELIQEADAMAHDGDKMQRSSNFQARRRVQVPLVARAVNEYLPDKYPMSHEQAQRLLVLAGDCAEDVFDVILEVKEWAERQNKTITAPFGLVKRFLETKKGKGELRYQLQDDEDLPPAPQEFLDRLVARRKLLIERGELSAEDYQ